MANYTELKKLNPTMPILIREKAGIEPAVWARYGEHRGLLGPLRGEVGMRKII